MLILLSRGMPLAQFSRQPRIVKKNHFRRRSSGFTLLELIVVILIIGLLLTFATISVGTSSSKELETEAKRFYSLLKLASEEAIMNTQEMALELSKNQYQFLIWGETGFQSPDGEEGGNFFRPRELPEQIVINLKIEETKIEFDDIDEDEELPKVGIFSSGEMTPFSIIFSQEDGEAYQVSGDHNGKIDYVGKVEDARF